MFARRLSFTAAAVAMTAAASSSATQAGGATEAHAARLVPVLIRETFTPLTCSGAAGHQTTLQMEGCLEKQILKSDTQINRLAAQIFPILVNDRARRDFNAAQRAWLSYRKADCLSMSNVFEGGTAAGVVDAQCQSSRNNRRINDLRAFRRSLSQTG